MRSVLVLSAVLAFLHTSVAAQECVAPEEVIDTTVSITRSFAVGDYDERDAITLRGTAWFSKRTELVSIDHVVKEFQLSHDEWREITVSQQYPGSIWWNEATVLARIRHAISEGVPEDLYVLELKEPLPWPIQLADIRTTPFVIGERVIGIGYTSGTLTAAAGQYIHYALNAALGIPGYFVGFELVRGNERDVLLAGSSGGPIFDCAGKVIGVIAEIFPESNFGAKPRTPEGKAYLLGITNLLAVPTHHVASKLLE